MMKPWVVAITGASGACYGVRLCRFLLDAGREVHLLVSEAGWRVLHDELGWNPGKRRETIEAELSDGFGRLAYVPVQDIGAAVASGSFRTEGMVIVPCSMGTLSAVARGASDNLIERAADVMLKEGRRLIVVPRETPLHAVHLENMLSLARMGVRIVPAMPAFYQGPQSLDDMVDFLVGKLLDQMGIDHNLFKRWGEPDVREDTHR